MDKLAEFEVYIKSYMFNTLSYILKNYFNLKLMVKSTSDIRKKPMWEEVLDFNTSPVAKFVKTDRLGWVYFNTCKFKLKENE